MRTIRTNPAACLAHVCADDPAAAAGVAHPGDQRLSAVPDRRHHRGRDRRSRPLRRLRLAAALRRGGVRQGGCRCAGAGPRAGSCPSGHCRPSATWSLNMERVVRVTTTASTSSSALAIQRCVEIMCRGMHQFQQTASLRGLPRSTDLDDYCYYVAGVVGQMLTELFCAYSPRDHASTAPRCTSWPSRSPRACR